MKDFLITPKLSRCGRVLLDWQQADLAAAASLSVTAVKAYENGSEKTRKATIAALQNAFEKNGIEFLLSGGLRKTDEFASIQRLTGPDFMSRFYEDIYFACDLFKTELLSSSADQNIWWHSSFDRINQEFIQWLKETPWGMRSIILKGHPTINNTPSAQYRSVPKDMLGNINYCVYGDRLAFVLHTKNQVLIIRNASIVETFRGQFEYLWKMGQTITTA